MLTGNDLLAKIDELHAENPDISKTDLILKCGYVKEDGKAAYTDFYTEILVTKGLANVSDEEVSDEYVELYEQLCDDYSQAAVQAFIKLYGEEELNDFQDCYIGEYDSEADFAEQYATDISCEKIPSWIVVDWEATWNCNLRYDFNYEDGFVFHN